MQIQPHCLRTDQLPLHRQQRITGYLKLRNTLKHSQQSIFVQLFQRLRCGIAEKDVGRIDSRVVVLFGVYHNGDFLSQTLLQDTQVRSCFVLGRQSLDFFPGQRSEYLDVAGCIGIAYVQPELVDL